MKSYTIYEISYKSNDSIAFKQIVVDLNHIGMLDENNPHMELYWILGPVSQPISHVPISWCPLLMTKIKCGCRLEGWGCSYCCDSQI